MVDVFTREKRSQVMARIRGSGNRDTEIKLIAIFRESKITGWRRRLPLFGKPDFVFPKERVAVFVDGCFWHGCPEHGAMPSTNRAFWKRKLEANKSRDRKVSRALSSSGWSVLRIWEHELSLKSRSRLLGRIQRRLKSGR